MKKFFSAVGKGIWKGIKWFGLSTWRILKWIFSELKDVTNLVIFIIVFLVVSSEVWVSYLLAIIFQNAWFAAVATACWAFWLGPFTPFLPLCIVITFGIRRLWNLIFRRKKRKETEKRAESATAKGTEKETEAATAKGTEEEPEAATEEKSAPASEEISVPETAGTTGAKAKKSGKKTE